MYELHNAGFYRFKAICMRCGINLNSITRAPREDKHLNKKNLRHFFFCCNEEVYLAEAMFQMYERPLQIGQYINLVKERVEFAKGKNQPC